MSESRIRMNPQEQKDVMLNILIRFSKYCDSHGLEYFLDAGTLLGAVRHKGYIPWDDDIDVNMPRKDYDRFCELTRKNHGKLSEHLYVEYSEDTIFPFLKIADDRTVLVEYPDKNPMEVGVYIDVFPKDGIKDSSWKSKIVCDVSYKLNLIRWFNVFSIYAWKNDSSYLKRIVARVGRSLIKFPNLPLKLQQAWIKSYGRRNPVGKCRYVTTLVNGEFHKIAPIECFRSSVLLEFEGNRFKAPVGYDQYLRCLYPGDYMTLPPEEKRIHHDTIVYWRSATAYQDFHKD